jgi:cation transport ATPase
MTVATRLHILIEVSTSSAGSDVDTLILDKTGTVTIGAPTVKDLPGHRSVGRTCSPDCSFLGFGSLHPVSRAVVAEAQARGIDVAARKICEHPGLGVVATIGGKRAILGRRTLLAEVGISLPSPDDEDVSQVSVAYDGQYLGRFVLLDQPRAVRARRSPPFGRSASIGSFYSPAIGKLLRDALATSLHG